MMIARTDVPATGSANVAPLRTSTCRVCQGRKEFARAQAEDSTAIVETEQ
jgi:hypothetical protein